jgi:predicted Fe-S protein YdhL (DUF1289 family)
MKVKQENQIDLASPCVKNCCLNRQDICLGCFRHIDEIVGWRNFSVIEQKEVLVNCEQRKKNNKGI